MQFAVGDSPWVVLADGEGVPSSVDGERESAAGTRLLLVTRIHNETVPHLQVQIKS